MGKYGIAGHTPVVKKNGFSGQREVAPMVAISRTTGQNMNLALSGTGNYSLSIVTPGTDRAPEKCVAPEAIVLKAADLPNGFYYVTGKIKNTPVHQNIAIVW